MSKASFLQRLQAGDILVSDGATGTNLFARGLSRGQSPEHWVIDQPDQILQLHRDFLAAGSDIILTSTFGGSSVRLRGSSLEGRAVEVNQRAAALALQACQNTSALVGGSIGPLGQLLKPLGPLTPEEAFASYAEQARALSECSVDLLVIETQFDLAEATTAIRAARSVSSLPIVASFSYDRGKKTMMGVSPVKAGAELSALNVDVIGINCGRSLDENLVNLRDLRQVISLPIWFKPNAGLPKVDGDGNSFYDLTPQQMGEQVPDWLAAGAQIVGGCCGTSPAHLQQIAQAVKSQKKTVKQVDLTAGSVHSIHITPQVGEPTHSVEMVHAVPKFGLEGDRYFGESGTGQKRSGTGRDITLIEMESLEAILRETGIELLPGDARRNIVTHGISLNDLVDKEFQVGEVRLRGVRLCEPCQHLASLTQPEVLPALVHRGGLRAEILTDGFIHVGDPISID